MLNFFKNEIHGDYAKMPKHQSKNRKEETQCKWTSERSILEDNATPRNRKKIQVFQEKKLEKHRFNETNVSNQTDNKMRFKNIIIELRKN